MTAPLRICWLADAPSPHTRQWMTYLADRGHQVHLISFRRAEIPNVCVHTIDIWRGLGKARYLLYLPKVWALVRCLRPDLLHAHHATSYGLAGAVSGYHPFLIHTWGSDVLEFPNRSILYRALVEFNLRRADGITATSASMAQAAQRFLRRSVPIGVVPFGVDLLKFDPRLGAGRRAEDEITVGVVKSLEPVYGLDDLLHAFALARQRYPGLQLLLVGDGSQREALEVLARELGVGTGVRFAGKIDFDQVPQLLSQMDIFALPSQIEGFGLSAVEAMAMELPVIASAVGGLPEIIADGETGFLVPPRSPKVLAERIVKLAEDADLRARMALAARARVAEKFDWPKSVERMEAFYSKILEMRETMTGKRKFNPY